MKQTHKEAIYLSRTSKGTRAHLAPPRRFFSRAGPPSGSRCRGALAGPRRLAQREAARSPAHWRTVAPPFAALSQRESRRGPRHRSQIKPLLLGGRLRSNAKMDGFECGWRRGRNSHVHASPARFDSSMLGNFIRRCWQDLSSFSRPGTGGASVASQVFSAFQSQGSVFKAPDRSDAHLCCRSTPCLRS